MDNEIFLEDLQNLVSKLNNPADRLVVAGIYYGFMGGSSYRQIINLKTSDVDFTKKIVKFKNYSVKMDLFLEKILKDAINQVCYTKMNDAGIVDIYILNLTNKHILKPKPSTRNENGINEYTTNGFKGKIRVIFEKLNITSAILKQSGACNFLRNNHKKETTIKLTEKLLKDNGLNLETATTMKLLKHCFNK